MPEQHRTASRGGIPSISVDRDMTAPASYRKLLEGYPGAALVVRGDGSVVQANAKGSGIEALLKQRSTPDIERLIETASTSQAIVAGVATLMSGKGEIVLEISVVPIPNETDAHLLLARDLTMERNLRTALVESRQRYKDLVEVNSDFAWEVGSDGAFMFVSPKGALGFRPEELIGRIAKDFVINPDEYNPLPFLADKPTENVEMWMRRADGTTGCVVTSSVPLYDDKKTWKGMRGVCRDVTEERESEAALARARHREQLLHYIVSTVRDEVEPHNMLTAAAAATARALSASGCRIYRLAKPGVFAVAAEYGNTEGISALYDRLLGLKAGGEVIATDIRDWSVLATATQYRQSVNGAIAMWRGAEAGPWEDDHHLLICDVANQLGIANEQVTNHERIVALSRTDSLTGLLNRRAFFEEELPRRLERLERNRESAALFYVDMDNFKRVNDVHGHQKGDEAILFLCEMLRDHSRPGDVIARLGGDEFAMWLDKIGPETTLKRATTLIQASGKLKPFSGAESHPLGISVGIALYDPKDNEALEELLARADGAMYDVKKHGKGGFRVAPPPKAAAPAGDAAPVSEPAR